MLARMRASAMVRLTPSTIDRDTKFDPPPPHGFSERSFLSEYHTRRTEFDASSASNAKATGPKRNRGDPRRAGSPGVSAIRGRQRDDPLSKELRLLLQIECAAVGRKDLIGDVGAVPQQEERHMHL